MPVLFLLLGLPAGELLLDGFFASPGLEAWLLEADPFEGLLAELFVAPFARVFLFEELVAGFLASKPAVGFLAKAPVLGFLTGEPVVGFLACEPAVVFFAEAAVLEVVVPDILFFTPLDLLTSVEVFVGLLDFLIPETLFFAPPETLFFAPLVFLSTG